MHSKQIDTLNIFLIGISLLVAYLFPFRLFLYTYAILGPLHYLTEMNWLDGQKYFVKTKKWVHVFAVLAFMFMLPFLLDLPFVSSYFGEIDSVIYNWINGCVLLAFILAIALVFFRHKCHYFILLILMGILAAVLLRQFGTYNIWIGIFLPTIIHVYLFTLLFMLFGALKSESPQGLWASLLLLLVPLFIIFWDITPDQYHFVDEVKQLFVDNGFHVLNANLAALIGSSDGTGFYFYEKHDLKMQVFIAFAYTYHYLNWFSKTSIIGWHKNLNRRKTFIILALWLFSVGLYWYDYTVGLVILLFLSTLHVFLEFPLNILSIKGIFFSLKHRLNVG